MTSDRIKNVLPSRSIELSQRVAELRSEGHDILGLNVGELDFPLPQELKNKVHQAVEKGAQYDAVAGTVALRKAIADSFDLKIGPENVFVGHGSKQVLYSLFQTLFNPGDEIIVLLPYWVSFPEAIKLAGAIPVFVETDSKFHPNIELIRKAIGPKTKGIVINSPNNPSGAVYSEAELREIGLLAEEKQLIIISDEAYSTFDFASKHFSLASMDNGRFFERTVCVRSFSKSFCMTGFRIGHAIAPIQMIKDLTTLQGHLTGNVSTIIQEGALWAMQEGQAFSKEVRQIVQKRGEIVYLELKELFDLTPPEGAFYFFPNVTKLIKKFPQFKLRDDFDLARLILDKALVAVLPGSAFGMPNHLRFAYTIDNEHLRLAAKRIKEVFK